MERVPELLRLYIDFRARKHPVGSDKNLYCPENKTVIAQVAPFAVTGFLDSVSTSGTAYNSGGFVSVNGFNIQIPDNLLVEFPALQVPFKDFAAGNRAGTPANEVSITGNIVNGRIIAGQMGVSQLSLQASQGYIASLSFDGAIHIANGPTIRINDPNAKYSAGYKDIPFFAADDENPSISSFGGFPMCVPRSANDPKCPQSNRPTNVANPLNFEVPDPLHMAPLKVGDWVEYSGIKVGNEIIVYELTANVGVFTKAGSAPGFLRVEDAIIGIIDNSATVEFARCRFVGLTTDPTAKVEIYAIDQDPCTGAETDRLIGTATPKLVQVDVPNGSFALGSGIKETADGILGGQYVQSVTEWIFPEVTVPGATPPANDYTNIGPLANGFGPDDAGNVFHQLSPFPGTAPKPSKDCPDKVEVTPPTPSEPGTGGGEAPSFTVNAGVDQLLRGGVLVSMAGNITGTNLNSADFSYSWTQVTGSILVASDAATVNRTFQLTVTHKPSGASQNDSVIITADRVSSDHPSISQFTWISSKSGTVTVLASTELVEPAAGLSMQVRFNNAGPFTMTKTSPGKYSLTQTKVAQPARATVQSFVNGVAVGGGTVRTGLTARGVAGRAMIAEAKG
ncbi:hypothetical protein H2203_001250 [Taxawa tesnikishii (nom. ined.)]|nr:hypothetical protein H2203_001250 [Dothideales sp. JES 119]